MEFAMALGGGGVKGGAEVGILKAFWEMELYPSAMSGTSVGGIMTALYGFGYTPSQLEELAIELSYHKKDLLDIGYGRILASALLMMNGKEPIVDGVVEGRKLEEYFCELTHDCDISELLYPIAITTVDINTGELVVFYSTIKPDYQHPEVVYINHGKLGSIMRATSAIPGVFSPKVIEGRTLVDGGVKMNTPLELAFGLGYDKVIAVDLKSTSKQPAKDILTIFNRSLGIMGEEVSDPVDGELLVMRPKTLSGEGVLDFSVIPFNIERGYREAVRLQPLIFQMLELPKEFV